MERFIQVILLCTFISSILAFNCNTVTDSASCAQMSGCIWTDPTCGGTFAPSCATTLCYYIDPVGGVDTNAGAALTPFRTLTAGFQKLAGKTGTASLIVLNYNLDTQAEILNYTTVTTAITMTINRQFNSSQYVINMQNFDLTTIPAGSNMSIYITAGKVEIIGAMINNNTVKDGVSTIFELGNAKLFLKDTGIQEYRGSAILVNSGPTMTTAQFNYTGGRYANSSFTFRLQNGATTTGTQHVFKEIRFLDVYATDYLIYALPLVEITNIFVKRGSATIYKTTTPQVTITNVTMKEYTGIFVDADSINKFSLTNSLFQNIAPTNSIPFIRLSNVGTSYSASTGSTLTNLTFQNVSVKHTVILTEKGYQKTNLDTIIMDNITKMSTSESPTLLDLEYESEWPGGLCLLGRKSVGYIVNKSSFTNIGSHCISLKTTTLTMNNNVFNNTALDYNGAAVAEDKMDESMGVTWLTINGGTTDVTPGNIVKLSQCKFYQNKIRPLYAGAIRIAGSFAASVTAADCEFFNNKAFYGGAIQSDNPLATITLTTSVFYQNQAKNGGAVWKVTDSSSNQKVPQLVPSGSNFTENSATGKGGAIYLDYDSMRIDTTFFVRNTAENGGGIYFIKTNPTQTGAYIKNCTFDSNYASNSGHAMKLLFKDDILAENTASPVIYINNTETNGRNVSDGRPSYYMFYFYNITTDKKVKTTDEYKTWISDPNMTTLIKTVNSSAIPSGFVLNHKSGSSLNEIILVKVFDDYDEAVTYVNKETLNLEITSTQNNKSDFEAFIAGNIATFTFEAGQFVMKSTVKIVGEPTTKATLTFTGSEDTSTILSDAASLINMAWTVNFTDCELGDIYNPLTKKCDTCPEGSYSLVDPYSNSVCIECDEAKATCPGGFKIAPKPGYWRFSSSSDSVLECPESDACLGGLRDEVYIPEGECAKPYSGHMCNTCDKGFAKFGDSASCVNCTTDTMYYVKFTGYFLIQLIALLYGVKCNVAKMSNVKKAHLEDNKDLKDKLKNEDFQSNLMKIAVNFLQVSAIVIQYKFEWPKFILDFVGVTNKIFPTQKEGFSMDCLITLITEDNTYTYFIKLIITLVQPFVLWVILILFYALYLKIKRQPIKNNPSFKKDLLVLFIITAFILQPTVMQAALQMFKCQNINTTSDPQYYMVDDTATECWNAFHLLWSVGIALPNFLLWAIVLPGVLLRMLIKRAKELKNPEIYARYSFVYEGLKTEKFYWEFVVLLRKMLVVLIFVFFNFISVQSQAFATFLVVIGFGCLHYVFWPYNDERLNRAEMVALISLGVMVYCGMFFLSNGGSEWLYTILIVVSLLFNVFFFVYLGILFIKSYKKTAVRMTKKISEAIEKRKTARSGSKSNNSSMSSEKKNTVVDIQDLSVVLGKVNINNDDYPGSPTPMMPQISEGLRLADHERHGDEDDSAIPSELNVNRWTSGKTVFNEEKVDVDNYSVLRSSIRRSEVRTKRNSGGTLVTPDLFQDVIHLYNMPRSSLANSNDQKFLGRSFSLFEKAEGPLQKEGQQEQELEQEQDQVNEDNREEQVEEPVVKKVKEDTEEKPEPEENGDENKRRSNNSDDNNQE